MLGKLNSSVRSRFIANKIYVAWLALLSICRKLVVRCQNMLGERGAQKCHKPRPLSEQNTKFLDLCLGYAELAETQSWSS